MIFACILGYVAIAASFYLYITRTAQIEPDDMAEGLPGTNNAGTTLRIIAGGAESADRKAA